VKDLKLVGFVISIIVPSRSKITPMTTNLQNGCAAICILLSTSLFAQQHPIETRISNFAKINVTELAAKELQHPAAIPTPRYIPFRRELPNGSSKNRPVTGDVQLTEINTPNETDLSSVQPLVSSPGPLQTFTGIIDNNTVIPPDVMGAAGPTYLMETLNSFYTIYSKTGTSVIGLSPSAFWAPIGSFVTDPHIAYDSLSKRWITCCIGQLASSHYAIFVGATQNSDPTGTWFIYGIDTGPSSTFPDYPLLGYNKNWVVITTNDYVSNSFSAVRIEVLNKSQLLSGSTVTVNTLFDSTIFTLSPAETLDPGQATEYLLADYNGNSGGNGFVRISTITGTVASPAYSSKPLTAVNKPWSETSVDEPQKGSTHLIAANDTRMGKVILRKGSIWSSQTIFLPSSSPTHSAVQWWQINPATNKVQQLGRLSDATGANRFAFPSIAVTASKDVLIGCSLFSSTIFASAVYAYRNHADSLNTLRSFFKYKAGGNTYYKVFGGTENRWGDYSATCIDYTDGSFWTLQEFATATANRWGTWWAQVGAPAFSSAIVKNTAVENNFSNGLFTISPNPAKEITTLRWKSVKPGNAILSIINIPGATLSTQKIQVAAGNNERNIPIGNLSSGTYIILLVTDNDIRRIKLVIEK
jgi:hypothetical protein